MGAASRPVGLGRRGTLLSRRLFVRRALDTTAGAWFASLAGCGDRSEDARTAEPELDAAMGDAAAHADAAVDDGDAAMRRDAAVDGGEAGGGDSGAADGGMLAVDSCEPFLTPLSSFFVQHGGRGTVGEWQEPDLDASAHRLMVDGEVATPLSLSLAELQTMTPQVTVLKTMECVVRLHGTALYRGVPVRAVLDAAGIDRDVARRIRFHGHDGFRNNLHRDDVYPEGDAAEPRFEPMLALSIDGEPLSRDHGSPVRLVLPDRFGFKNVKWLARIEATRSDEPVGDYQELGLASDEGIIFPNTWYRGEHRMRAGPAGAITLCGHAVSGFGGITSVEVAVDDDVFRPARIVPLAELLAAEPRLRQAVQVEQGWDYPFVGVKAPWELELEVTPGEHALTLRVSDASGEVIDNFRAHLTFDG